MLKLKFITLLQMANHTANGYIVENMNSYTKHTWPVLLICRELG